MEEINDLNNEKMDIIGGTEEEKTQGGPSPI